MKNTKDNTTQEEKDRKAAEDHRRLHPLSNNPPSPPRSPCPLSLISGQPARRIPKKDSQATPEEAFSRRVHAESSSPGQALEGKRAVPSHTTNTKNTGALFARTSSKTSPDPIRNSGRDVSSSSTGPIASAPKASKAAKKSAAKAKRAPKAPPRKKISESSDDNDDDDCTREEQKQREFTRLQARLFKEVEDTRKADEEALQ